MFELEIELDGLEVRSAFWNHIVANCLFLTPMTIQEFKRLCRNRNFYLAQVYCLEEEIKKIDIYSSKPRSPKLEVIGAPAHDYESHIVDFIARKISLEKERDELLARVEIVDSIRTEIPKPWNDIFWKDLVEGLPVRRLIQDYGISKDMYYRRLNKLIGGLICSKKTD